MTLNQEQPQYDMSLEDWLQAANVANTTHHAPATPMDTEPSKRKRHLVAASVAGGVALLVVTGAVLRNLPDDGGQTIPQTEPGVVAASPSALESQDIPEALEVNQTAPAEKTVVFEAIGCTPTSLITVDAVTPVSWLSTINANGKVFRADNPGFVKGQAEIQTCHTDPSAIKRDANLSDAAGIPTYTLDGASLGLTFNPYTTLRNSVYIYDKSVVLNAIQAEYKKATPFDAKRLLNVIEVFSPTVTRINKHQLRSQFMSGTNNQLVIEQAYAGIEAAYEAQASEKGQQVDVEVVGAVDSSALDFTPSKEPPEMRQPRFKYHEDTSTWTITVEPIGGTA